MKAHCNTINVIFFEFCLCAMFSACNNGGNNGQSFNDDSILESDYAYQFWPNGTTTDTSSSEVVSKILISDLDHDGYLENIFLSAVPRSTNKNRSLIRITRGANFEEVLTFDTNHAYLLQGSRPFAHDIDADGSKELFFVSNDRDRLYALGFKDNKVDKLFFRWSQKFPDILPENFDHNLRVIDYQNKKMIKVENYGIFENSNKRPEVISL